MLTTIHKLSESWFFKGILIVTSISFMSFFGIGGIDEIRGHLDPVIKVGDVKVSGNELARSVNAEVEKMRKKTGGNFTLKDAMQSGVISGVIDRETSRAVISMISDDLDITITPEMIVSKIYSSPEFQNEAGEFDRRQFEYLLSLNRISEKELTSRIEAELTAGQIFDTFGSLTHVPNIMADYTRKSSTEKRDVKVVEILFDDIKVKEKPTKDELLAYYETDKEKYMNPEYRNLSVAVLSYADILNSIPVSDAEIKARYEKNKSFYVKPERREVLQMRFDSKEKAQEAVKKVKSTGKFKATAKEMLGQSSEDTSLGFVEKEGVLSELGEPIFTARKGDIIGPVQSTMGWHVLEVAAIEPEVETPFAKVKNIIADDLRKEIGSNKVYEQANQLDDFLGSGKTLEEAAEHFKFKIVKIIDISVSGETKKGKKLAEMYTSKDFLDNAFSLSEGAESPVSEFDKGFYVVRVDKVTSPSPKPLEEVKADVEKTWRADKQKEVAELASKAIIEATTKGTSLEKAAKDKGFAVSVIKGLKKQPHDAVSARVAVRAFATPLHEVTPITLAGGFVIVEVDKISFDKRADVESLSVVKNILQDISNRNTLDAVIADFSDAYNVEVDYKRIKQIFEPNEQEEE